MVGYVNVSREMKIEMKREGGREGRTAIERAVIARLFMGAACRVQLLRLLIRVIPAVLVFITGQRKTSDDGEADGGGKKRKRGEGSDNRRRDGVRGR